MFEGYVEREELYTDEEILTLRMELGLPLSEVARIGKIGERRLSALERAEIKKSGHRLTKEQINERRAWYKKLNNLVGIGTCPERVDAQYRCCQEVYQKIHERKAYPELNAYRELSKSELGNAAEQLVKYRLARMGIEFLDPPSYYKSCDVIIRNRNGDYKRCEVKGTGTKYIRFVRTVRDNDSGKTHRTSYSIDEDIDFFICVCLVTEQIFILPWYEVLEGKDKFSLLQGSYIYQFKDRYDLLYDGVEDGKEES